MVWFKGRDQLVTRVLSEATFGPLADADNLRRTCKTKNCVNPVHNLRRTSTERLLAACKATPEILAQWKTEEPERSHCHLAPASVRYRGNRANTARVLFSIFIDHPLHNRWQVRQTCATAGCINPLHRRLLHVLSEHTVPLPELTQLSLEPSQFNSEDPADYVSIIDDYDPFLPAEEIAAHFGYELGIVVKALDIIHGRA